MLKERFKLEILPETDIEFMEIIGRQRGCLGSGGYVDFHRIANILINEYRTATLGRITLETPAMAMVEQAEVDRVLAEKAAEKEAQEKKRKQAFKARQK
jgi:ribosome biogenesis GTPase A